MNGSASMIRRTLAADAGLIGDAAPGSARGARARRAALSSSGMMRRSSLSVTASGTTLVLIPPLIRPTTRVGWPMPGTAERIALRVLAVGVEGVEDPRRRLERVVARLRLRGVRRLAGDHDLEVQAAVVRGDDAVGEAGADREVGLGEALLQQPFRPDRAARFLVVGQMQLDRARRAPRRATSARAARRRRSRSRTSTPPRRGRTSSRPGSRRRRGRRTSPRPAARRRRAR